MVCMFEPKVKVRNMTGMVVDLDFHSRVVYAYAYVRVHFGIAYMTIGTTNEQVATARQGSPFVCWTPPLSVFSSLARPLLTESTTEASFQPEVNSVVDMDLRRHPAVSPICRGMCARGCFLLGVVVVRSYVLHGASADLGQ